jgi:hypothetical protein
LQCERTERRRYRQRECNGICRADGCRLERRASKRCALKYGHAERQFRDAPQRGRFERSHAAQCGHAERRAPKCVGGTKYLEQRDAGPVEPAKRDAECAREFNAERLGEHRDGQSRGHPFRRLWHRD